MEQLLIGAINGTLTSLGISFFDKLKKNKLEKRIANGQAKPEDYYNLQIMITTAGDSIESSNAIMYSFLKDYPMNFFPHSTLGGNRITQIILNKQSKVPSVLLTHPEFIYVREWVEEGFRIMKSGNTTWVPKDHDELLKIFIPKAAQLYYLKGLMLHIDGEINEAKKLKEYACGLAKNIAAYGIY